jgi:hypothetical protein
MPCPSRPPWLDHSNYTWRRVQVMKLLSMQFSPTSRHFISLRSKYCPATDSKVNNPVKKCKLRFRFSDWILQNKH